MNNYNFELAGGFPLELDIFKELQDNRNLLQAFGDLAGNFSIIKGCEVAGDRVGNGVVYYNNEVIPFVGGISQTKVVVKETEIRKQFKDGTQPVVLVQRVMCFGTGATAVNWSSFKRPKTTLKLTEEQGKKEEKTVVKKLLDRIVVLENRPNTGVPIGLVAIWGLPLEDIPKGWVEHVPLIGRTPIGYDQSYTKGADAIDYKLNEKGAAIGAKDVQLSIDQMPKHHHHKEGSDFDKFASKAIDVGGNVSTGAGADQDNQGTEITVARITDAMWEEATEKTIGNSKPHSNIQPSRVVEFIRYIGFQNN